ncbi:MAG: type IV secretion system DNA-binding domain-containing protein [Alphaproteobacteria bacterium]|nr:type IV secretion system DNA-binding domain-containing protein [Alphaproteobacteria bacterium]
MAFVKTITQGGQVHIHQLRMLKQILIAGSVVAFVSGVGCFVWKAQNLPHRDWRMFYETYWAKFMVATNPVGNHPRLAQMYTPPIKWAPIKGVPLKGAPLKEEPFKGEPFKGAPSKARPYKRSCLSVLNDPLLKKTTQRMELILEHIAYLSLKFAALMFSGVMGLWFFMGRSHKKPQHQRGNTLVPWQSLKALIRERDQDSDLKLAGLPLLKDKETSHILITGTTGSGKTNAFHVLLPQIRKRQNRAIVVDVTGDYVSRYYDPMTDIILNPLDTRSLSWNPWADCELDAHYDVLAESFIQTKEGSKDPFWDNAARAIFKTALRKFAFLGQRNIEAVTTFLLSSSDKDFEDFFKGTEAATYAVKNNEKTTSSIRSVLSSQIEGLRQLDFSDTAFSIRDWVMNGDSPAGSDSSESTSQENRSSLPPRGWLFITARADQRQTLKPLISAWVDMAINALMVLPENYDRRLWFVIDELAALQRLPRLQMGLAEARKYGGCILAGFQSKPQLEEIYSRNGAESMLDLFNTKLFFRCTEPSSQAWISKVLGDKEEAEPTENISYGANSTRDGVSLSRQTRQKPLVLPAEFSQLKDLECYIKLPGDYPCTKLQMGYQKSASLKTEPFLLKPEKMRDYSVSVPVVVEVLEVEVPCEELKVDEILSALEIPELPPDK